MIIWPPNFIMKYLYENFWVPFFGKILSKFVFLIEAESKTINKKKGKKIE